jgi:hypothetical protein
MSDIARGLAGLGAGARTLPVLPALEELLSGGALRRGSVLSCSGSAAVTLAVSMVAGASQEGAWVGIAGLATLGVRMLGELGLDLGRVVLISGQHDPGTWADVLAASIDGFDVVLADGSLPVRPAAARRLHARVQSRGAVLVLTGVSAAFTPDLQISSSRAVWSGLGEGHGVATARQVTVEVHGRRAARRRCAALWLPAADGTIEPAEHTLGADGRVEVEAASIAG